MFNEGKVSMDIGFQESEVMRLLQFVSQYDLFQIYSECLCVK